MSALFDAIESGDLVKISALYDENLVHTNNFLTGTTALSHAIRHKQTEAAKLLIQLADSSHPSYNKTMAHALIQACDANNNDVAHAILDAGISANTSSVFPVIETILGTPLTGAVRNNNFELAERLLQQGADIDAGGHRRPVNMAAGFESIPMLEWLFEHGAKININLTGCTYDQLPQPLVMAVNTGNTELVQWLLDHGANPDTGSITPKQVNFPSVIDGLSFEHETVAVDPEHSSALHYALSIGCKDIAEILLTHGAGLADGNTPLHQAILNNDINQVSSLLSQGVHVNVNNGLGKTPFDYAVLCDNTAAMDLLYQYGATFDDIHFESAIDVVANEAGIWLVEHGINFEQTSENGKLFNHAISFGSLEMVQTLVEKVGVDIHRLDHSGHNSLFHAIGNKDPLILEYLIEKGVNPNQCDLFLKQTPLWVAVLAANATNDVNYLKKIDILLDAGADLTIKDYLGHTVLEYLKNQSQNPYFVKGENFEHICEKIASHANQEAPPLLMEDVIVTDSPLNCYGITDANITRPDFVTHDTPADSHHDGIFGQIYNWFVGHEEIPVI